MNFFIVILFFSACKVFSSDESSQFELDLSSDDNEIEIEVVVNGDMAFSTSGTLTPPPQAGKKPVLERSTRYAELPGINAHSKREKAKNNLEQISRKRSPSFEIPPTPRVVSVTRRVSDEGALDLVLKPKSGPTHHFLANVVKWLRLPQQKRFTTYRSEFKRETSPLENLNAAERNKLYKQARKTLKKKTSKNSLQEYLRQANMGEIWAYFRLISKESFHAVSAQIRHHNLSFLAPISQNEELSQDIKNQHQLDYLNFLETHIKPIFETSPLEVQQFFYDLAIAVGESSKKIEDLNFDDHYTVYDFSITNFILYIFNPLLEDIHLGLVEFSDNELLKFEKDEKKLLARLAKENNKNERLSSDTVKQGVLGRMNTEKIDKIKATYTESDHEYELDKNLVILLQKSFSEPGAFTVSRNQAFFNYFYDMLVEQDSANFNKFRELQITLQKEFFNSVKSRKKN